MLRDWIRRALRDRVRELCNREASQAEQAIILQERWQRAWEPQKPAIIRQDRGGWISGPCQ